MIAFLLGILCGFVLGILFLFIYASIRVGGDNDE